MELQDAPANYVFKLWPWFEANKIRVIWGCGIIVVAAGLISFYSWQQDQKEITAGNKLTQLATSIPGSATTSQQADLYLKIATDYQGTSAGQRALLQGAAILFAAGKYADAQVQFQKFRDIYPGSSLADQADLGVATSLDAQGKTDSAAVIYQRIINSNPDALAVNSARFSLARIDEQQGKFADAMRFYEDIIRSMPNSSLSSEAGMRAMELKTKLQTLTTKPQSALPSNAPAAPFKLNR
jgi:TolA-binding protein